MASEPEDEERRYKVASHLSASGTVGLIPNRLFYVTIGTLVLAGPFGYVGWFYQGWIGVLWAVPMLVIGLPFGACWCDPPPEHGLIRFIMHVFRKGMVRQGDIRSLKGMHVCRGNCDVPTGNFALAALLRKVLRRPEPDQRHACANIPRIEGDAVYPYGNRDECVGILSIPTVNLDLASVRTKRRHRGQLGTFFDGIATHDLQIVIRTEYVSKIAAIERMRLNRNPFAHRLADWLTEHIKVMATVDRRRYLMVPAENYEVLTDRIDTITRSLRQRGRTPERITHPMDLKDLIDRWWTWRPHPDRVGPEAVVRHANYLESDGEFVQVWAMAALPPSLLSNWWAQLVDGDLPCDVSMKLRQKDLSVAKWKLTLRYNDIAASRPSPGRTHAKAEIQQLLHGFEGAVRPWDVEILFVVRGATRQAMERNARRLQQQFKDLSAKVRLLKWEQIEGMQSAQPLCLEPLAARQMYWETGYLTRTTADSASTLQIMDGVPWGMAGATPILITTAGNGMGLMGRHFCWYGKPGAGKGFGVRAYLARRHWADQMRLFLWDSDEAQHEYAGRFTEFLKGQRLVLNTLEDVDDIELEPRWQVVAFDVSGMDRRYQAKAFAKVKRIIEKHILAFPGPTAVVVDEAVTLAEHEDQSGAIALGDAVQIWRKWGVEVHVVTQRVSDWFHTPVGRKIQGNAAVKWYGAQEDSEMYEVAKRLHLSQEETDRIVAAGIGEGLLDAFGRRVWANLYDQCSPEEVAAYSTDPPERVEVLSTSRIVAAWNAQANGVAV